MDREKTNSKYKTTAFGSFKKVSNFGLLASLIVAMVFLGYATQKGNNSEVIALPQTQPRTTTVSSNQQSSSVSSNNGDQSSSHSNTQDAISTSSNSDSGASSSSSGSSSDTNNLTGDINGLVGNINKNINRIIQNSVQNSVSGTVSASTEVNKMLSGKIASSQLNLKTGTVERIIFGDWSLDAKSGKDAKFSAKFSIHSTSTSSVSPPASSSEKLASPGSYTLSNLKINGVQKTNEDITLRGTVDITRQSGTSTQSWTAVPTTVSVTNHSTLMIMSFDQTSPVSQVFQNVPVIGVITANS